MRHRLLPLLLVSLIALSTSGCASLGQFLNAAGGSLAPDIGAGNMALKKIDVKINKVGIISAIGTSFLGSKINWQGFYNSFDVTFKFALPLEVANPFDIDIPIQCMALGVSLFETPTAMNKNTDQFKASLQNNGSFKAKSKTQAEFRFDVSGTGMITVLENIFRIGFGSDDTIQIPWKLSGSLIFGTPIGNIGVRVATNGQMSYSRQKLADQLQSASGLPDGVLSTAVHAIPTRDQRPADYPTTTNVSLAFSCTDDTQTVNIIQAGSSALQSAEGDTPHFHVEPYQPSSSTNTSSSGGSSSETSGTSTSNSSGDGVVIVD